jgi:hypothetical protein
VAGGIEQVHGDFQVEGAIGVVMAGSGFEGDVAMVVARQSAY